MITIVIMIIFIINTQLKSSYVTYVHEWKLLNLLRGGVQGD
jgi:hypothetical protein